MKQLSVTMFNRYSIFRPSPWAFTTGTQLQVFAISFDLDISLVLAYRFILE